MKRKIIFVHNVLIIHLLIFIIYVNVTMIHLVKIMNGVINVMIKI